MTRNDVIRMSLQKKWENADLNGTKQNIYQWKGFDESFPKTQFLLNLSHFVKSYTFIYVQFYHDHSLNIVMSRDSGFKF